MTAPLTSIPFQYSGEDLEVLAAMRNYRAWMLSWMRPFIQGRTLEIGAGCGSISREILPWADQLTLLEPDAALCTRLHDRFALDAPRVAVIQDRAETHLHARNSEAVDSIVLINVLEHIPDDQQLLHDISRVLTGNGHLLLFVPALPILYAAMDAHLGHCRRYLRTPLIQQVEAAGLQIVLARYFDLPGIFSWLLLKATRSVAFNPAMVRIYDRWIVPPTRWLEQRITPPAGKNLLLVARKSQASPWPP
ncbi:MAG: class I SAM-dependent methyltransferase [Magnetococcales bacterium]|nr:class I SAM-dependent methyltransferase [Magnetococcales bacterium]NGZ05378.1 class I SAM-dependent methyltransferase [Magnetococcales bacterium]